MKLVTRPLLAVICGLLLGATATASAAPPSASTKPAASTCAKTAASAKSKRTAKRGRRTKTCSRTKTKPKAKPKPKSKPCPKVKARVKVKVKVMPPCRKGHRCPKPKTVTKTVTKLVCAKATKAQTPKPPTPQPSTSTVSVTQTSHDLSQAMAPQANLRFSPGAPAAGTLVIEVNDTRRYQRYTGVGGAMTDTSAWLIWDQLSASRRSALMQALFSPDDAHLSFLRVPMGASDFTATGTPYSYDDQPTGRSDPSLSDFSVAHDQAYILPALHAARQLNPSLYLEALPWSPPGWMKSNDALDNVHGAGSLLAQYYPTLAQYFVKFLQTYAADGVPVNAISPQNEPTEQTIYPGMQFSEAQEATFDANYLDPALAAAHLTPNVFGWDLSWGPLNSQADPLVAQSATGTISGLAWHCYAGSPDFMAGVHNDAPRSMQIVDECTTGSGDIWNTSEMLIASFRNWANAVAVWNLALNQSGGPVQAPNEGCGGCTGVATVNPQTGTYSLSSDYYDLAQLSHFVQPGAVRIDTPTFATYGLGGLNDWQTVVSPALDDVAFLNPNGSQVLFLYNNGTAPITFAVQWDGSYVTYTIPAEATTTLTWH